ncbi:MAG: hypothetical protein A4E66_02593 [Syntrophus sp. PtaB.Bin001]|nr:MAG: hypothetical protein A4E66_02593 [Syntrophus sp. PtaB.Bin001]
MNFIPLLKPPKDGNSIFNVRFPDHDGLETPLQGRVFLDVLSVLIQSCGANTAQLAARQGRFEHVGCIHGPFRSSGADHRMYFIDKQNNFTLGAGYFLQYCLESILKFSAIFSACHEGADIQTDYPLVFQAFRNVAIYDSLCKSFDDRSFSDAWFTDQHRVILCPSGKDLHDSPYFVISAYDRIESALKGQFVEILGIPLQGLVFFFGIGVCDSLITSNFNEDLENAVL